MTYPVTKLITGAFYGSGIVSRGFETVEDSDISDGLLWLNDIILETTIDFGMIPYETKATFAGIVGQETYDIDGLVSIDTLTYVLNNVRYPMYYVGRDKYNGEFRSLNIQTLPYQYNYERIKGGSRISIYFKPDQAYTFEINGTYSLSAVTLGQDLELTLDQFYITYLRYALIDRICAEFAKETPAGAVKTLKKYTALIEKNSRPPDLELKKVSTLSDSQGYNWAVINLGNGWL